MIWQCKGCNTLGFYWDDEQRDKAIEEHKNCPAFEADVDPVSLDIGNERPKMDSVGPCPDVVGWTPGGTPDTGLGGGTPDSGKFSHPQYQEPQVYAISKARIIAEILAAWDDVKREGIRWGTRN